jgi:Ca2+-binding RTX toxin-like protein
MGAGLAALWAGTAAASKLERLETRSPYSSTYDIVYTSAAGEANDVTFSRTVNRIIKVHDPGAPITAVAPTCKVILRDGYCSGYTGVNPPVLGYLGVLGSPIVFGYFDFHLGDGNDRMAKLPHFEFPDGRARIWAGPGDDQIDTRGGFVQVVYGEAGADLLLGDAKGFVFYGDHTTPVTISLDGLANDGSTGEHDNVIGFGLVGGGAGADTLIGGPADDRFLGYHGADRMYGADGDDQLSAGDGDVADGGPGDDAMGEDSSTAHGGFKTMLGGAGNDTIFLREAGEIDAGPGDDSIEVWTSYAQPARQITCGTGDDTVHANPDDVIAADCEHVTIDPNH